MLILGIETSCDETAVAVLSSNEAGTNFALCAEVVSSQIKLHEAYGGVVPELASREHLKNLPIVLDQVLKEAQCELNDIELIAVTRGPGLKGCLLIGLDFAQGLALAHSISIIGVNHIEGHLLSPLYEDPSISFPYLGLIVSGGHTEIVRVDGVGRYSLIARSADDAAGEAFDKAAALLGFSYPGGPQLAKLADTSKNNIFSLPKVMREAEGFSFSGLKTAISLLIKKNKDALASDEELRAKLCAAIQDSIVDALCYKLKKAIKETSIRTVCVGGGVSANQCLRRSIQAIKGVTTHFPALKYCTDNGVMIAHTGALRFMRGERMELGADVKSRWPVWEVNS